MYRYRASKIAFGLFARPCLGPTGSQHAQCHVSTLRAPPARFLQNKHNNTKTQDNTASSGKWNKSRL